MSISRSNALAESFIRYRNKEFDQQTDEKLKKEGQAVLDKYAPQNNRLSRINIHNVFWMIASIAVFRYTDFYIALRVDERINRLYLYPGMLLILTTVFIMVYLIGYYHYYKGIIDYEKYSPYSVPVATISFIAGMLSLCIALWPVWSIFTPFILFTLFMGAIFMLALLPL